MPKPRAKTTGSDAPLPGRCGARLAGSNPPRYCTRKPPPGQKRCTRNGHNGGGLVGPANGNFKHGRTPSKYMGVLPPGVTRHLQEASDKIASSREEIALIDARIAQLLARLRDHDPQQGAAQARQMLRELLVAQRDPARQGDAAQLADDLESLLGTFMQETMTWAEVGRNLELRARLSAGEIKWQQLMADKVLVGQLDAFMRAIAMKVTMLTEDRKKISAFVREVATLARGAAPQLVDAVDVEVVGDDEEA